MMRLPGSTHAPLRTAARTPTLATRRGGLAAKDTQRAGALCGWLRLRWPLRYAYSTHTGSSREGRRNCLIPPCTCDGRRADITRQIPRTGGAMKVRARAFGAASLHIFFSRSLFSAAFTRTARRREAGGYLHLIPISRVCVHLDAQQEA